MKTIELMALLFFFSATILSCASFGSGADGKRLERMKQSTNYDIEKGEFKNEIKTEVLTANRFSIIMKFFFGGEKNRVPERLPAIIKLKKEDFAKPPAEGFRITWLGHSTMLLEIEGKTILIDPVFSKRTSPYQWVGPARFHEVPITIKDLPKIDVVLISHDHYDHLDYGSIQKLNNKTGLFVMPLGVGAHVADWGIKEDKIKEFDWWQKIKVGSVELICTPARHFSGRGLFDEKETLWASWVIRGKEQRIFYSGDTGPMARFKQIGQKHGPFDLTMMQLGAYGTFWPYIHLTPEEAMVAHKDLKGKRMLAVHWGTFDLGLHSWNAPLIRTKKAALEAKVTALVPRPGQRFVVNGEEYNPKNYPEFSLEAPKD